MGERLLRAWVSGRVQGVGFRYRTRRSADELGLRGSATNLPDGRVEIIAQGSADACDALLAWLRGHDAPGSVTAVDYEWDEPRDMASGFATG